jgi:signal transduction histidine kinase
VTSAIRGEDVARTFLLSPFQRTAWYATGAVALGAAVGLVAAGVVYSALSSGLSTLLFAFGAAFIAIGIEASRLFARVERWRAFAREPVETRPPAHPYRPLRGRFIDILRAEFTDENRWRDVLYVALNLPLSLLEFGAVFTPWAIALGLFTAGLWYETVVGAPLAGAAVAVGVLAAVALVPVAASLAELVMRLHRSVVANLLCTSPERELRREVETLRRSRAALVAAESSELQRIERDLHDGAQQRLVSLAMDLGLASEKVDTDPGAAKTLIIAGRDQAQQALAELRELVRGIAPSILLDRGLIAAIESIADRASVPTELVTQGIDPALRLPLAVERTAYFVAAEGLANVAKHSRATRCRVNVGRTGDRLLVEITDDGRGGTRLDSGRGLRALKGRVEAVDGSLSVSSPAGGPTVLRAEIPIRYEPR